MTRKKLNKVAESNCGIKTELKKTRGAQGVTLINTGDTFRHERASKHTRVDRTSCEVTLMPLSWWAADTWRHLAAWALITSSCRLIFPFLKFFNFMSFCFGPPLSGLNQKKKEKKLPFFTPHINSVNEAALYSICIPTLSSFVATHDLNFLVASERLVATHNPRLLLLSLFFFFSLPPPRHSELYWHDLIRFSFVSLSGSLIWTCHTRHGGK